MGLVCSDESLKVERGRKRVGQNDKTVEQGGGGCGRMSFPHVVNLNIEERPQVKNWTEEPEMTHR